jgi:predicted phage terminase large subunit-like protein
MDLVEYNSSLSEMMSGLSEDQYIPAMRQLCRTDLYFLLRFGLNRKDVEREWLYRRCKDVEASPDGHLDLWSREHYKSTIITVAKTIQDILRSHGDNPIVNKELTFGIFSHTRPIAKSFLRQIKREFEGNPRLKEWFPDILFDNPNRDSQKWSEDDGIIVKRKSNPKECTVEAWGVVDGQPIGKHFDGLIYDDVVTRDSVNTPDMINKTTEMLELSYALGAEGGFKRFIGTRYHFNDTYNILMQRGTGNPRIFPATEDGSMTGVPVLMGEESLKERLRDMGQYTFSCQMLQNPIADESQGFKKDWIRFYDNVVSKHMTVYILVDSANSKKKGSDYSVFWVIGLGPDKNYYVLDVIRDRFNLTQRTEMLFELHQKWKPHRKGVRWERYGLMGDVDHIKSEMEHKTYRFDIVEVGGQQAKEDRIKRLIPLFEQNRFYFPHSRNYTGHDGKTLDLIQVFIEQEYKSFPVALHDDMMDSLSRIAEPDEQLFWPRSHGEQTGALARVKTRMKIF